MFRIPAISRICKFACGLALAMLIPTAGANASAFSVFYTFQGGVDGASPTGNLITDGAGNFYGTTAYGGNTGGNCPSEGCGTIFEITPAGKHTVLYSFQGGNDGETPYGSLVIDASGNLYGVTELGGANSVGTVFEWMVGGSEVVLYTFQGGSDGAIPDAGLIIDQSGNLYGVTGYGGDGSCYCGTVFTVSPRGDETVLHRFTGSPDGDFPYASLAMDSSGNLYGTTVFGGQSCSSESEGCGFVFEIEPTGVELSLYSFCSAANCADGALPVSNLSFDGSGNLYGTTFEGGASCSTNGCGTIFELINPQGSISESVLHAFQGSEGAFPLAGVTLAGGNLFGTTCGNSSGCQSLPGKTCPKGCDAGDSYEMSPSAGPGRSSKFIVLHSFSGKNGGADPISPMLLSGKSFYGTTPFGGLKKCSSGVGCGIAYKLAE